MCWIRRRLKGLFFIRLFCFREAGGLWGRERYGSADGKTQEVSLQPHIGTVCRAR